MNCAAKTAGINPAARYPNPTPVPPMRSIFLPFLSLCMAVAAATAAAQNVFPYHYQNETLPNGLRVILIPMPGSGLISYWSIVRTGSRDEIEPGKSGYAHFFEHMMFRGTEKHPNGEYDRLVTAMGADPSLHGKRPDRLLPHFRQGRPAEGRRAGERPLPEAQVRSGRLSDRGGGGLRRVSQGRDAAGLHPGRTAARHGLRRPHLQAHDHGFRGRREGHAQGL